MSGPELMRIGSTGAPGLTTLSANIKHGWIPTLPERERPGHHVYFGVTSKGVTDKSGRYPPAPITKATSEPLKATRTKIESVATRNFI